MEKGSDGVMEGGSDEVMEGGSDGGRDGGIDHCHIHSREHIIHTNYI